MPGDHSEVGAGTAARVARRIGLDSEGREIVTWLVRNHLLMADVATRRDLSDAAVADNLADACAGDAERLRLLYLLTIGDSHATGPAAWGMTKGALLRDLFVKVAAAIERGEAAALADDRRDLLVERIGAEAAQSFLDRLPDTYLLAFSVDEMVEHAELLARAASAGDRAIRFERAPSTFRSRSSPATDRGLLATLAGALTVCGLDVIDANLFGTTDGLALDVFRATDPFGRLERARRRVRTHDQRCARRHARCRAAGVRSPARLRTRSARRRGAPGRRVRERRRVRHRHASSRSTPTTRSACCIGWPRTFADLGLDVRVAKVATTGERVVDVFYVRDANGEKVEDPRTVENLRRALARARSSHRPIRSRGRIQSLGCADGCRRRLHGFRIRPLAVVRDALRHRSYGPRVHAEPVREGTVRRGAQGRGRHPRRRDRRSRERRPVRGVARDRRRRRRRVTSHRRSRSRRSSATTRARSSSRSAPTPAGGSIPSGWADVGYSPSEIAIKEVLRGDRHRDAKWSRSSPSSTDSASASRVSRCTRSCSTAA